MVVGHCSAWGLCNAKRLAIELQIKYRSAVMRSAVHDGLRVRDDGRLLRCLCCVMRRTLVVARKSFSARCRFGQAAFEARFGSFFYSLAAYGPWETKQAESDEHFGGMAYLAVRML